MATNYQDLEKNRTVAPRQQKSVVQVVADMKPEFERALPRHMSADRMLRIVLTEFRKNPALLECTRESLLGSVVTLAQLGLEPGVLGQAYLIPYKGVCTPVPGWQGLADLVSRSGRASIWTGAVREGDDFRYNYGDRPFIEHHPGDEIDSRLQYVYAVGRIKNAEWPIIEVWSVAKVERHRNLFNKVGTKHYSYANQHNFEQYARKVALLQVIRYMPKSIELQTAVELEHEATTGEKPEGRLYDNVDFSHVEPAAGAATQDEQQPDQEPEATPARGRAARKPQPKQPPAKPSQEAAEPEGEDPQGDAGAGDGAPPPMSFPEAFNAISRAATLEDLDEVRSRIATMSEANRKKLDELIANKLDRMQESADKDPPSRKSGGGLGLE